MGVGSRAAGVAQKGRLPTTPDFLISLPFYGNKSWLLPNAGGRFKMQIQGGVRNGL